MFTRTRSISAVDRIIEAADFQVDVKQVSLFAVEPLNVEPADAEGAHEVGGAVIRIGEDADIFAFEDFWAEDWIGGNEDEEETNCRQNVLSHGGWL